MKLLTAIVSLLSVSSAAAAGWGRPQGQHLSPTPFGAAQESTRRMAIRNKEQQESADPLAARGGGKAAKKKAEDEAGLKRLIQLGNIGNIVTFVLSGLLLYKTVTVRDRLKGTCTFVDILMTIPLVYLRVARKEELTALGLEEYYLNTMRIVSVLAHGVGHLVCSIIDHQQAYKDLFLGERAKLGIVGTMAISHFIRPGSLSHLKSGFGILQKDLSDDAKSVTASQAQFLNRVVAPFLSMIGMTQAFASPSPNDIVKNLVFGAVILVLMKTATPPGSNQLLPWIFTLIMLKITPFFTPDVIPGAPPDLGPSFILVFTSTIAYGSICLLSMSEEKKKEQANVYTTYTWVSSVVTTVVGWALALICTDLLKVGGHVLYDFSIPASYLLTYFLVKRQKS